MKKKIVAYLKGIKLFKKVYQKLSVIFFYIVSILFPIKKKTIVFESFLGKQFSDNPRALYELMNDSENNYDMYWSMDSNYISNFENHDIPVIKRLSFKWLFMMATAKYWVTNSRLPLWLPKRKGTIYIQTWHGTPLKKLGIDIEEITMPGTNTTSYKENFIFEAGKWDYLISPNTYSTKIFRRAFSYRGEIVESGYPRNDYLISNNNNKTIKGIKGRLNIPLSKKIILYAPTWRDNEYHDIGKYSFKVKLDLKMLKDELEEDYIIILRMHYLIYNQIDLNGFEGFIYDHSLHEDIRDLYLISDILITDYSSVFFDYAILGRPIYFYVYDLEKYRDKLRGFYFDFEKDAPGPLFKNTKELVTSIKNKGYYTKYEKKLKDFQSEFNYLEDGNSSKRVVHKIFDLK